MRLYKCIYIFKKTSRKSFSSAIHKLSLSKLFVYNSCLLIYKIIQILTNYIFVYLKNLISLFSVAKLIDFNYNNYKQPTQYNYDKYATTNIMYPTWIDNIYNKIKIPNLLTSILIGFLLYFTGYFFSFLFGFHINYAQSIPVYLGMFGIVLTMSSIRFSSLAIHNSFSLIRPCFIINDKQYNSFISIWFLRLSNNKAALISSLIISFLLILIVSFRFYHYGTIEILNMGTFNLDLFENKGWLSDDHKAFKLILFSYFTIICTFPLITAGRILLFNFLFLLDLRNLPIIPIPNLIRTRLRGITFMYIIVTSLWFIGVSLFGILFFNNVDIVSITILSTLSILGIVTFLTPQLIYHKLLIHSEITASKLIFTSFYKMFNISLIEKSGNKFIPHSEASTKLKLESLVDYFEASIPVKRWVYTPTQIFIFLLGQSITLLSPEILNLFNLLFQK